MGSYNYFGATTQKVIDLYPGTVAADFGGDTLIADALGRAARELAGALSVDAYRMLAEIIELEMVEDYATAGQTVVTLGLLPYVANTLHVWAYSRVDDMSCRPVWGENERAITSVVGQTVTLTVPLAVGDKVFCSYEIDAENAAFSWPSCADLAIYGAAAELGARLYTEGTQQWDLVKQYQDKSRGVFTVTEGGALSRARAGIWVPDELRTLRFWKEVDPLQSSSVGSVRRYRA